MVESIIAAVYIDQGLEEARGLIARWLGGMMSEAAASPEGSDYKTVSRLCKTRVATKGMHSREFFTYGK